MRNPVVIIRTVSVEKMSPVLDACVVRWPDAPIWVVSTPGRVDEMRRDKRVDSVIGYEQEARGFGSAISLGAHAVAIVVPVSNEKASGYGNVLKATLRIKANDYFICSRCRILVSRGKGWFLWKAWNEHWFGRIALCFSGFWAERILDAE